MRRDVSKSLSKYDRYAEKHEKCGFYLKEAEEILIMAKLEPFSCMNLGYKHGFMVGYRAALRDMKKRKV